MRTSNGAKLVLACQKLLHNTIHMDKQSLNLDPISLRLTSKMIPISLRETPHMWIAITPITPMCVLSYYQPLANMIAIYDLPVNVCGFLNVSMVLSRSVSGLYVFHLIFDLQNVYVCWSLGYSVQTYSFVPCTFVQVK
jgi:hypothetical protein